MKSTEAGNEEVLEFPRLSDTKGKELNADIHSRAFMAKMFICENATDVKAKMMLGGQSIDFGEGAREAIKATAW